MTTPLLLSNNHATGGTCFGDSGGPNFLGDSDVVAAVTSLGLNYNCAGTGKSNTTANLAALIASQGRRVGVVDTDIASPGIHVLFGLEGEEVVHSLNDYLWGRCEIRETAHDVTANLGGDVSGRVFLVPSSIKAGEIACVLREGYDGGCSTTAFAISSMS